MTGQREAAATGVGRCTAACLAMPITRCRRCAAEMHDLRTRWRRKAARQVTRGRGLLARIVAAIVGFPRAGEDVPVRVDFKLRNGRERWTRTFAGRTFHSTQEQGHGRDAWLVCERFGPVKVAMALVLDGGRLRLIVRRWSVFAIPLPLSLAPGGDSYEYAQDGRFHFHVEIWHLDRPDRGLPGDGWCAGKYRWWTRWRICYWNWRDKRELHLIADTETRDVGHFKIAIASSPDH